MSEHNLGPPRKKRKGQRNEVVSSKTEYFWEIKRFDLDFHDTPRNEHDDSYQAHELMGKLISKSFIAGEDIGLESLWHAELEGFWEGCFDEHGLEFPVYKLKATIIFEELVGIHGYENETKLLKPFMCYASLSILNKGDPNSDLDSNFDKKREFKTVQMKHNHQELHFHIGTTDVAEKLYDNKKAICFVAELEIFGKEYISPFEESSITMENFGLPKLQKDLEILLNSPETSDFIIKCKGKDFYVHKAILSARSKFFYLMFSGPAYKEVQTNEMTEDIDKTVMEILLEYVYTGKQSELMNSNNSVAVVHAAEKYELTELSKNYFKQMLHTITDENYGFLAILASVIRPEADQMNYLKEYCERNLQKLMKNPEFRKLAYQRPEILLLN